MLAVSVRAAVRLFANVNPWFIGFGFNTICTGLKHLYADVNSGII